MTSSAVLLILLSVVVHVAWNWLGKRQRPSAAFFWAANTAGGLFLVPAWLSQVGHLSDVPAAVWGTLTLTGFFQAFYYAALAGAYRSGDLSVAYPIARSLPPVLVLLASLALGRGGHISAACGIGIGAIVLGGLALPLPRFTTVSWRRYREGGAALAALAAVGTAGYSLLDDHGLRLLREAGSPPLGVVRATLLYAPLEFLSSSLWLGLYVALHRGERAALGKVVRGEWRVTLWVGLGIAVAYGLVLVAMAFVADVSYVVAFRQLSVPLAAAVGVFWLGEAAALPRTVGVGLVTAGLVLVAVG